MIRTLTGLAALTTRRQGITRPLQFQTCAITMAAHRRRHLTERGFLHLLPIPVRTSNRAILGRRRFPPTQQVP